MIRTGTDRRRGTHAVETGAAVGRRLGEVGRSAEPVAEAELVTRYRSVARIRGPLTRDRPLAEVGS